MLKNWLFPELREKLGPNFNTMLWQQDRAPSHTSGETTDSLIGELDDEKRIISSRGRNALLAGLLEWAPYSLDLTPLDFWFWAVFKKNRSRSSKNWNEG